MMVTCWIVAILSSVMCWHVLVSQTDHLGWILRGHDESVKINKPDTYPQLTTCKDEMFM